MAAVDTIAITGERPASSAVWSLRLALFCTALVIVGIVLHRLMGLPTPVLMNLFLVGFGGAAVTVLLTLGAMIRVWISGRRGGGAAILALFVSLTLLACPAVFVAMARDLPRIYDVSTDLRSPPQFASLARQREGGANSPEYPGAAFADLQTASYPDLQPIRINRSAEEAFELAADAVRRLKFHIVSETPPGADADRPGLIEATDRTLLVGYTDDVVIRIVGDQSTAVVDMRSASRYGSADFGTNAGRVRAFAKELRARLESTVPGAATPRGRARGRAAILKRLPGADRKKAGPRSVGDRAKSDAQRAPALTARPR